VAAVGAPVRDTTASGAAPETPPAPHANAVGDRNDKLASDFRLDLSYDDEEEV
jgi:hypothetical protein